MPKKRIGAGSERGSGRLIKAGDLSVNIAAVYFDIRDIDAFVLQIIWSGAAVGAWKVELSSNYLPKVNDINSGASSPVPGSWTDVTAALTPAITQPNNNAASSPILVGLPHTDVRMQAKYGRISYVASSGAGSADVFLTGKTLGN